MKTMNSHPSSEFERGREQGQGGKGRRGSKQLYADCDFPGDCEEGTSVLFGLLCD
jgi:hypothetical protein